MPRFAVIAVAALALAPSAAQAHYLGAYAVSDHHDCGRGNLPGTVAEVDKLLASPDFPDDLQANFYWKNARVKAGQWRRDGDYAASSEALSGFDGADASLLSYIATHGRTVDGVYTAVPGGGANNCAINSTELALGDQRARYLVLSTCRGLMIGTGDDPLAPGEDPRKTWRGASAGLNCIFGYSNDMADFDSYGASLLHELATTDETLVEAFFRASHDASYSNIPAALCFGSDEANARERLETSRRFVDDKFGVAASAYVFERSRPVAGAFDLPHKPLPRLVKAVPAKLDAARAARAFLGQDAKNLGVAGKLAVWRSKLGTVTFEPARGQLTWRKDALDLTHEMKLKDDFVVRIAADFIRSKGLGADLSAAYIIDRGASAGAHSMLVAKTVVLYPRLDGLALLSSEGAFEVTVGADGQVSSLTASPLAISPSPGSPLVRAAALAMAPFEASALAKLQASQPDAKLTVVNRRAGYARTAPATLTASVEILIEASQGGFSRRYTQVLTLP